MSIFPLLNLGRATEKCSCDVSTTNMSVIKQVSFLLIAIYSEKLFQVICKMLNLF